MLRDENRTVGDGRGSVGPTEVGSWGLSQSVDKVDKDIHLESYLCYTLTTFRVF